MRLDQLTHGIVYVAVVHLLGHCEARQSAPNAAGNGKALALNIQKALRAVVNWTFSQHGPANNAGVQRLSVTKAPRQQLANGGTKTTRAAASLREHDFSWRADQVALASDKPTFLSELSASADAGDMLVAFTGDTQYWFRCTASNYNCHRHAGFCDLATNRSCIRAHGDYANSVQRASLSALGGRTAVFGQRPRSIVVNGDLTNFGHERELREYETYWTNDLDGMRLYPGLGNHDYANNVNECGLNHCAHRMLMFFKKYVSEQLGRPMDIRTESDWGVYKRFFGSLAYSWDECTETQCVHFVQLNNYPTYDTEFDFPLARWHIKTSLNWLPHDLRNTTHPVVVNLHDFDTKFTAGDKRKLADVLRASGRTILAVFFAHYHSMVGLHPTGYWCINERPVPLLYSGSVPANNYMVVRFRRGRIESAYVLHADSLSNTVVSKMYLANRC